MSELDVIYEYVAKKLSPKRMEHTIGVSELAGALAIKWGESETEAHIAALLHDSTKEKDMQIQLLICDKYSIMIDYDGKSFYSCVHADTAAAQARAYFNVSDNVYNAIKYHTIARENMSVLEKIIFISDKSEKGRDARYKNAERIRQMAEVSLDAAMKMALEDSVNHVMSKGGTPHHNTMLTYTQICREGEQDDKTQKEE